MGDICRHRKAWALLPIALLLLHVGLPASASACDQIQPDETFWIRLLDPIASYSAKPGMPVRAMLVESPQCEGSAVFAAGSEVDGSIKSVRRVGMGFVHETARVQVVFDRIVPPGEQPLAIDSAVLEISNARETVHKGVIFGIRSTDSPEGRITSRLRHLPTWYPYSDWFLLGYRLAFPIAPEPEIYLPPGADLRLQLTQPLPVPDRPAPAPLFPSFDETDRSHLDSLFQSVPERTMTRKGQAADVVNLAFMGTQKQLDTAFRAAGWRQSDPTNTGSVLREFRAFIAFQNYPAEPISRQLLGGERSDMNWEKGLDSYAKRDHLRIWRDREPGQDAPVWLSAFVRETGAALSFRDHKFIHHVDANLDEGRDLLIRDLALAGCVDAVEEMPRPEFPHLVINATHEPMRTDGSLAVVRLKDCEQGLFDYSVSRPQVPSHPHSRVVRYLRTELLAYRSDVIRGNILYSLFDVTRMSVQAFRRHRARGAVVAREPHPTAPSAPIEGVDTATESIGDKAIAAGTALPSPYIFRRPSPEPLPLVK